jgi:sigma-B regulation protein RsbU (phosphoserine phosphatase)
MGRIIKITNRLEEVPQMMASIEDICTEEGIDEMTILGINLALEEAVVNVVNYAYPEGTVGDIEMEVNADAKAITFILRDHGKPFDPTAAKEVDITLSAEERQIGGLGIHLIRNYMDEVKYDYCDGQNVLTLVKNKK